MVNDIYKASRFGKGDRFEWKMSWVCEEAQLTKNMIDEDSICIESDEDNDEKYLCFKTTYGVAYRVPSTHIKDGTKVVRQTRKGKTTYLYN